MLAPDSDDGDLQAIREALVLYHMEVEQCGDAEAVVATFAEPHYDLVASGQVLTGAKAVAQRVRDLVAAMPDATIEPVTLRHADDAVIVETRTRGRHVASLYGLEPTGRPYDIRGIAIFRFDGSSLVEEIVYFDRLTLIEQLSAK